MILSDLDHLRSICGKLKRAEICENILTEVSACYNI